MHLGGCHLSEHRHVVALGLTFPQCLLLLSLSKGVSVIPILQPIDTIDTAMGRSYDAYSGLQRVLVAQNDRLPGATSLVAEICRLCQLSALVESSIYHLQITCRDNTSVMLSL